MSGRFSEIVCALVFSDVWIFDFRGDVRRLNDATAYSVLSVYEYNDMSIWHIICRTYPPLRGWPVFGLWSVRLFAVRWNKSLGPQHHGSSSILELDSPENSCRSWTRNWHSLERGKHRRDWNTRADMKLQWKFSFRWIFSKECWTCAWCFWQKKIQSDSESFDCTLSRRSA